MLSTRRFLISTVVAAGLLLVATACSSQGGAPAKTEAAAPSGGGAVATGPSYTIAMVTHEQPGTTFWDRIRAGAEQAAAQHGITLKYSNDPSQQGQATLVQNAIDSKVDAITSTLQFPDAVGPELQKAADAGIPTVVFNGGMDVYQKYGAKLFFGSDEALAGKTIGERIAKEGGSKTLCVVHAQDVQALETRCDGVKQGFPDTENLQVDGADLATAQATLQAKLAQDPSITNIVTLDAGVAGAAVQAKEASNSQAEIAAFDLSQEVVTAIQEGTIEYSVDQQPYLQGYLAIDSLWLYLSNGNDIGGGLPVLTGPSFVDRSNVDAVAGFAANNTR